MPGCFPKQNQKSRAEDRSPTWCSSRRPSCRSRTDQLRDWNKSLEDRVETQLGEIERIRKLERFLAPQVAQLIASSDGHQGLLDSHRREVTVVFCDLRGFTAFTEQTEPEEAMNVLREYHAALGELIFRYEGTLGPLCRRRRDDPFQCADPVRGPRQARAVKMSVEMRDTIGELTQRWRNRGHNLGFGIGIARLCHARPDRLRAAAGICRHRQRHQSRLAAVRRGQGGPDRGQPPRLRHGRTMGRGQADRRFEFEGLQSSGAGRGDFELARRS